MVSVYRNTHLVSIDLFPDFLHRGLRFFTSTLEKDTVLFGIIQLGNKGIRAFGCHKDYQTEVMPG